MQIKIIDEDQTTTTLDTQDRVKEAITGEALTIDLVGGVITVLEAYDGAACEIIDNGPDFTFTATSPGLFRLKATSVGGVRQVLIRVVDRSVLAAIPDHGFVSGYGEARSPRLVLRSVCNRCPEAWDGSADWFYDGRIKLSDHGAVMPQL